MSSDSCSLSLSCGFRCQPSHIFEALTDPKLISAYTQSKAESEPKEGGKFSFFDGSIHGEYTKFNNENSNEKSIEMKWRQNQWEADRYSNVKLTISAPNSSTCLLKLDQTNIPTVDKFGNGNIDLQVKHGWQNIFFERIQKVLGYGKAEIE